MKVKITYQILNTVNRSILTQIAMLIAHKAACGRLCEHYHSLLLIVDGPMAIFVSSYHYSSIQNRALHLIQYKPREVHEMDIIC